MRFAARGPGAAAIGGAATGDGDRELEPGIAIMKRTKVRNRRSNGEYQ